MAKFLKIVTDKGLTRDQVHNCDETGLYWRLMPSKTLVTSRETEAKGFKSLKTGSHSWPVPMPAAHQSFLWYSSTNMKIPIVSRTDKNELPVEYYSQKMPG